MSGSSFKKHSRLSRKYIIGQTSLIGKNTLENYTDSFNKALVFAANAHGCQKIDGSEIPYIVHPVMVAWEVISMIDHFPEEDPKLLIQAALLHDVLEDTNTTRGELREEFGEQLEEIVFLLSKRVIDEDYEIADDGYLNRLSKSPKAAQIIKMADRISNLRPPPVDWSKEKIRDYLKEAQKILHRLGSANQAMANRLNQKIEQYAQFIVSGQY